jgi:hypothetical protein
MRTDAHNPASTASTTHLPEQKETIHMAQMLRKEACSGEMEDRGHVRTEHCPSDCLTKQGVKLDALIRAVETGVLPELDTNQMCRSQLQHREY